MRRGTEERLEIFLCLEATTDSGVAEFGVLSSSSAGVKSANPEIEI